jgi:hypothetical protein
MGRTLLFSTNLQLIPYLNGTASMGPSPNKEIAFLSKKVKISPTRIYFVLSVLFQFVRPFYETFANLCGKSEISIFK